MGKISFLVWVGLKVFTMQRIVFRSVVLSSLLLALMALPAPRAVAQVNGNVDDGAAGQVDGRQMTVQGPLGSIDCAGGSITMYGVTYLFTTPVSFHTNDNNSTDGGADADQPEDGVNDTNEEGGVETLSCIDVAGFVDVKLSSVDGTWMATEVGVGGGFCEDGICDYGLVSGMVAGGTVNGIPITVDPGIEGAELFVEGAYVEVTLEPGSLTAAKIDNGEDVDEVGPDEIGEIAVTVLDAKTGKPVLSGAIGVDLALITAANKVVRFRTVGNGAITLKGLPLGTAKLVLTRVVNGKKTTAQTWFSVPSTGTKYLRLRFK
jgi:hypothetical protein